MRVKRYVADTLQEAIARVKADLGRNAIILHTKQFKEGGFFGFFAKRRFEVIAALDENAPPATVKPEPVKAGAEPEKTITPLSPPAVAVQPGAATGLSPQVVPPARAGNFGPSLSTTQPAVEPHPEAKYEAAASAEPALDSLREELAEMKELLRQAALKPAVVMPERAETGGIEARLREQLSLLGLDRRVINDLINDSPPELRTGRSNLNEWSNYCQQLLTAKLMFSDPLETPTVAKQQVIALIGPTGVGKTTTIAKMAANFSLFEQKKVGLVTIDTYRIAAVEHLKTYGDIMKLPVEVVYTPADMEQAIAKLSDCEVILVDTAGRSPRNQAMMDELHQFIATPLIQTILLVISATTQYQDMVNIEQKFSRIAYTHLVFTKLDETGSMGPIISLAWNSKRPISYLTVGQNVPDDIEVAKPDQLVAHLFKGMSNG